MTITKDNKIDSYADMFNYCTGGNAILNNDIVRCLMFHGYSFDVIGDNDIEEDDEIFSYYIINYASARRFAELTNEIVISYDALNLNILCVTHWGTPWESVPANWR